MNGRVPEKLASKLYPLWSEGFITDVTGRITGEARSAPKGTSVQGGGIQKVHGFKVGESRRYMGSRWGNPEGTWAQGGGIQKVHGFKVGESSYLVYTTYLVKSNINLR